MFSTWKNDTTMLLPSRWIRLGSFLALVRLLAEQTVEYQNLRLSWGGDATDFFESGRYTEPYKRNTMGGYRWSFTPIF